MSSPLKVTFISHSDIIGGAAMVTFRLMNALRRQGVDARMVVYTRSSDDPNVSTIGTRFVRGMKFMVERAGIAFNNGFSREDVFKVSTGGIGMPLHRHKWVKEADVIVLGWFNQGLLSLRGIRRLSALGKPIVWVMHDMWAQTGVCHHAYDCTNYRLKCGKCRFLGVGGAADLSYRVWRRKMKLYDDVPITFVAVSTWLARRAARSSLLGNRAVRVIPNAFPVETFNTEPSAMIKGFGIPDARNIILMGAARLDDPIKGLQYAVDALNWLFDNRPDVARTSHAVFFGNLHDRALLDNLRFPHTHVGRIDDHKLLRDLYALSSVVLSTSLYETLPGTLIEGQAAGCLPVTFGRGGQGDIVTHKVDGYIADYLDPESVADGIIWALQANVDRDALHESVARRFDSVTVARRFISLFNELLERAACKCGAK